MNSQNDRSNENQLQSLPQLPDGYLKKPDVFAYDDYRTFIKDSLKYYRHAYRGRFNMEIVVRLAGFRSRSLFSKIIHGKATLTLKRAEPLARALKLNRHEADYFKVMVEANNSAHPEQLNRLKHMQATLRIRNRLAERRIHHKDKLLWHHIVIREILSEPDFPTDPEWIAEKTGGLISKEMVQEGIDYLIANGYLYKRNDTLCVSQKHYHLADGDTEHLSPTAEDAVENTILLAKRPEAIETQIHAVTASMNPKQYEQLRSDLSDWLRQRLQSLDLKTEDKRLYQINVMLAPIIK